MANFCTLNPLYWNPIRSNSPTLSEGNLYAYGVADAMSEGSLATTTGKYYFEAHTKGDTMFGIGIPGKWGGDNPGGNDKAIALHANGDIQCGGVIASSGVSFNDGNPHRIMIAYDHEANKIWFGVDGTWGQSGDPANGTGGQSIPSSLHDQQWIPAFRITNSNTDWSRLNFGQLPWIYDAPSGFSGISTENLAEPPISNLAAEKPEDHFNVVTYTGNGGTQSINTVGFAPDLVWAKNRTTTGYHHELYDRIRGDNLRLFSSQTPGDTTGYLQFDTDGFNLSAGGGINASGDAHVAWNWKAGGAPTATNSVGAGNVPTSGSVMIDGVASTDALAGSIPATNISANTTSGFSIVTFTSTGSDATVAHGLSTPPDFITFFRRNTSGSDILVYHSALGATKNMRLNNTDAVRTQNTFLNTEPTSSVFSIEGATFADTRTYVAYCWSEVEGFSKMGQYTGNGNASGPFIYTGFKPSFVLIKPTTNTDQWILQDAIRDTYNPSSKRLFPNLNNAEVDGPSSYAIDFLSNGFKPVVSHSSTNQSGEAYIYMAVADSPFKYSSAR